MSINQEQIYEILSKRLWSENFLNKADAEEIGWTIVKQKAWESFVFHRLGRTNFNVPMNEIQLLDLGLLDAKEEENEQAEQNPVLTASVSTQEPAPAAPATMEQESKVEEIEEEVEEEVEVDDEDSEEEEQEDDEDSDDKDD